MSLPFLRLKKPKIQMKQGDTKLVNASQDEILDDKYMSELFEAAESRNVAQFRSALEAYVSNMFEENQ